MFSTALFKNTDVLLPHPVRFPLEKERSE